MPDERPAVVQLRHERRWLANNRLVTAVVEERIFITTQTTPRQLRVRYTTETGQKILATVLTASTDPELQVGDTIDIHYLTTNPGHAKTAWDEARSRASPVHWAAPATAWAITAALATLGIIHQV
ncbi:DUF3592 domain-containing protein [Streptomyces sp. NPDC058171]